MTPTRKALLVCFFFSGVGLFGWIRALPSDTESLLLLAYYITIVINTYFSVQIFARITPTHPLQTTFDLALCGAYCTLAFLFDSTLYFSLVSALLFAIATAKYVHINRLIDGGRLLPRKILIDTFGVVFSLIVFGVAAVWSTEIAAWTLAVVFALANVYLLVITPMYRLD